MYLINTPEGPRIANPRPPFLESRRRERTTMETKPSTEKDKIHKSFSQTVGNNISDETGVRHKSND